MTSYREPCRIERAPVSKPVRTASWDDNAVLRLSRASLRTEPPEVRFVGRLPCSSPHATLPWNT